MMARWIGIWGWLAVGHAAIFGLYWAFLVVPESNVAMLAVSLLLVLAMLVGLGLVELTALGWMGRDGGWLAAVRASVRRVPWWLAGLVVFALFAWAAGRVDGWHAAYRGQIDAWLIARFNATESAWVHRLIDWGAFGLRSVLGVALALALTATPLDASRPWYSFLRRGLHWRALALTTLGVVGFIALPWQAAGWRPAFVPPTGVELVFVTVKLGALYLVATLGWMLALAGAVGHRPRG